MPSSSSTQPRVAIAPAFQWDSQAVYLLDIAAYANGLSVIAAATGHSSYEDLHAMHPEVCATSLADLPAATGRES